jgi:superfamily II DNA or RNA helicase
MAPKKKAEDSADNLSNYDDEYSDSASDDSEAYSDDEEDSGENKQAECIRRVGNFSSIKPHDILDKKVFNADYLSYRLERAAPKLVELMNVIDRLDRQDTEKHGKMFKHMIFTDQRSANYGAKIVLSALLSRGFQAAFHVQGKGFHLLTENELPTTKDRKTVAALVSKPIYGRPMAVPFKKALLDRFNKRPENIQGDLIRFIVLDQGFKEGIDLYDVKYVHLLEPLLIPADEKQAIGRGTRFCGQRGLEFHPTFGWPLYVFKYDIATGAPRVPTLHDLYLQYAALDFRKIAFAAELETETIEAAVDATLTHAIHGFSIPPPSPILKSTGGAPRRPLPSSASPAPPPPPKKLDHRAMTKFVETHYKNRFTYEHITLKNNCQSGGAAAPAAALPEGTIVQFTPTQDFVRHYFTPASPYKGMLLWHSVGTGKTCTAIATATHTFEPQGYTILWVTRHTLKSDIFKNLFRQVCSLVLQDKLLKGDMKLPKTLAGPMKHLSDRWITPISYKQFTNLLLKKNKYYTDMVARNGAEDPLKKTLLIIDEAHKLYSEGVAASERPNTEILEEMIQKSYQVSGADSVRMLVMTATPYTEDGMELVKLLNLLRESREQFPVEFEEFAEKYLTSQGEFSMAGSRRWRNDIAGYVSYLNRSKDARNFAYPVLTQIRVPMTKALIDKEELPEDGIWMQLKAQKETFKEAKKERKEAIRNAKKVFKDDVKDSKKQCLEAVKAEMEAAKKALKDAKEACKAAKVPAEKKQCVEKANQSFKTTEELLKKKKAKCAEPAANEEDLEDTLAAIDAEFKNTHEDYLKLEDAYKTMLAERKENNKLLKELKPRYTPLKFEMKKTQIRFKNARKEANKIKNKAEKRKQLQMVRETEGAAFETVKDEFVDLKNKIANLRIKNKVSRLRQGSTTVGDISQEKALVKRCKVNTLLL